MRWVALRDGRVDLEARVVNRSGIEVELRAKEAELLAYLARRADRVVPRSELLVHVWGYHPESASRTLDTTVRRLRSAIEPDPSEPVHVLTVPGEGYRWGAAGEVDAAQRFLDERVSDVVRAASEGGVVALWGPPGIGRSRWAEGVAAAWGCPRISVGGEGVGAVARALGLSLEDAPSALSDRVLHHVRASPTSMVLDDLPAGDLAWAVACARAAGRPWLGCVDERPRHDGVLAWAVSPMPPEAAAALFRRVGAVDAPAWLPRLGGVPKAIELAARLCELLGPDAERHVDELLDVPGGDALAATLGSTLARLPEPERASLHRLLAFGGPVPAALAQRAVGVRALSRLIDAGLLLRDPEGRLVPFLADTVRGGSPPPPEEVQAAWEALSGLLEERLHPLLGPLDTESYALLQTLGPILEGTPPDAPLTVRRALVHLRHARGVADPTHSVAPGPWPADRALWAYRGQGDLEGRLAALDEAPPSPSVEVARLRLLRMLGRVDEADRAAPPAGAEPVLAAEWSLQRAVGALDRRRLVEALEHLAAARVAAMGAPFMARRATNLQAFVHLLRGELVAAGELYGQLRSEPLGHGVLAQVGAALVASAGLRGEDARREALEALGRIDQLSSELGHRAGYNIVNVLLDFGDAASVWRALALLRQRAPASAAWVNANLRFLEAVAHLDGGALDAAEGLLVGLGDEPSLSTTGRALSWVLLAAARELRGDPDPWPELRDATPHARLFHPRGSPETLLGGMDAALDDAARQLTSAQPAPPRTFFGRLARALVAKRRR